MDQNMLEALAAELDWHIPASLTLKQNDAGEISLTCDGKHTTLTYTTEAQLARGLALAKQYGMHHAYTHTEKCCFDDLGIMVDCSRNAVLHMENLKRLVRVLALMGYNHLMLYTEDTYEIEGEPYFGYQRGRYTNAEMKEIDAYAKALGIEIIPCIQTLAHLQSIFHWNTYGPVNDCNDILLCDEEKTYALIDKMLATMAECFSSRRIHIGMDEAHMVGLGKYLDRHGPTDRFDLLTRHLDRVCQLAEKYGYRPMIWSDMFFRLANHGEYYVKGRLENIPDCIWEKMPKNLSLVYWDYYQDDPETYLNMMREHKRFERDIWFAGGAWRWIGFAPENYRSLSRTRMALDACRAQNIRHMNLTCWGDNGAECSLYAVLPTLFTAAALAYGVKDQEEIEAGFYSFTGIRYADFMALDEMACLVDGQGADLNPSKYLLYNDTMRGVLDHTIAEHRRSIQAHLQKAMHDLVPSCRNTRYGYLFRTHRALARLLSVKYDLGLRLRAAYLAGDREGMATCAAECRSMVAGVRRFRAAFRTQWMLENKPHGFDVQDLRLGALTGRLQATAEMITEYLNGKIDRIAELEEPILPFDGRAYAGWAYSATVNRL